MSWVKELKIALIVRDFEKLEGILSSMPENFSTLEEMDEALAYLEQVRTLLLEEKEKTREAMERIKKMRQFAEPYPKESTKGHL